MLGVTKPISDETKCNGDMSKPQQIYEKLSLLSAVLLLAAFWGQYSVKYHYRYAVSEYFWRVIEVICFYGIGKISLAMDKSHSLKIYVCPRALMTSLCALVEERNVLKGFKIPTLLYIGSLLLRNFIRKMVFSLFYLR
ncbi:hypothetical protein MAR_034692 [Mya arenaria]|uniref:Uncharacterized protein n=1 Tax=Mya arenaria TaxID=6604 RepID=A0ABY7ELD8_MYAAR|nr:hypothetical protein MAR_034692 [Mya arenaria]